MLTEGLKLRALEEPLTDDDRKSLKITLQSLLADLLAAPIFNNGERFKSWELFD